MAKLYGSVGGQTKEIKKLYGSVGGQAKKILKLYGSVEERECTGYTLNPPATALDINTFNAKLADVAPTFGEPQTVKILTTGSNWWYAYLYPVSGSNITMASSVGWSTFVSRLAQWGITADSTEPSSSSITIVTFQYGLVGRAKLIYQDTGA